MNATKLKQLIHTIEKLENTNLRRLSELRRIEIRGFLSLRKRSLEKWFSKFLNIEEGSLSERLNETRNMSRSNPLWALYYKFYGVYDRIEDLLKSLEWLNRSSSSTVSGIPNELVREIEFRVRDRNDPENYTHLESILEIANERNYTMEEIRPMLSESIRQKLEAIARKRRLIRGSLSPVLPL